MKFEDLFHDAMDRDCGNLKNAPLGIILNLGAGGKLFPGTVPLDYPEWDADKDEIPYGDKTVAGIIAFHFLEHCADPVKVLQECQRVLKVGGLMDICVPYYSSQMQAHDLDHKAVFCEETWKTLFNNPYYDKRKITWKFKVNFNMICGIVERNLALITQLEKVR